MNCINHSDMVVNTSCDICHKPFCPSCLLNDRGRFVCKQCFDPENQPAELASTSADLSDEERLARIDSKQAFWQSPTGAGLHLAGISLLIIICVIDFYLSLLKHDYLVVFIFITIAIAFLGPLFVKSRQK